MFIERWSPRAFDGGDMPEEDLLTLFEAARWAPSAFNVQPWRFVYSRRGNGSWPVFLELLTSWNRLWARSSSALIVIASDKWMAPRDGERIASPTYSFDAGAAWAMLALQASLMGYKAHGLAGFDRERAARDLGIPSEFQIEAMVAVGRPGKIEDLPESLRARETPSSREPLQSRIHQDRWQA